MPFADIPEQRNFEKKKWAKIVEGKPILFQLLDDKAEHFVVHTVPSSDGKWVKIPHRDDSPLMQEEHFYKQYRKTNKYQVNILDVTPHIINEASGNSYYAYNNVAPPTIDPTNGDDISKLKPRPLNEVNILEGGVILFNQLNGHIGTILAENPDKPISSIVFQIQAFGSGRSKVTSVFPRPDLEPQDVSSYSRYELVLSDFSDEEIMSLLRGVPLKEIFSARRREEEESSGESDGKLDFTKGLPGL